MTTEPTLIPIIVPGPRPVAHEPGPALAVRQAAPADTAPAILSLSSAAPTGMPAPRALPTAARSGLRPRR